MGATGIVERIQSVSVDPPTLSLAREAPANHRETRRQRRAAFCAIHEAASELRMDTSAARQRVAYNPLTPDLLDAHQDSAYPGMLERSPPLRSRSLSPRPPSPYYELLSANGGGSAEPLVHERPTERKTSRLRLSVVLGTLIGLVLAALHATGRSETVIRSVTQAGSFGLLRSAAAATPILHSNGHLYLPAGGLGGAGMAHPIHALIQNATESWARRVAGQSQTLAEAVREYKRRYNRNPPRGFDRWFAFAKEQGVILVDDYDGIDEDVTPFLALDPHLLQARMAHFARQPNTHTLVVRNGAIEIASGPGDAGLARARDQRDLLKPCMSWLSDTNVSISPHDGPSVLMDEPHRRRHREAGQRGEILSTEYADSVDDDPSLWGFPLACGPHSRLQRAHNGLEVDALPVGPSFIHDHIAAMDLCANPEWQDLHGFTSWPGPRPTTLLPIFSMSRLTMHNDLRLTPLEQYRDTFDTDPDWQDKTDDRAVWRGSTTGVWFDHTTRWRSSQRVRLYWMSKSPSGQRAVRFIERRRGKEVVTERMVSLAALYKRYLDFAFVGEIVQCTEKDRGCEAAKNNIELGKGMIWNDQNRYKYFLDIDGNAWSGRFHRLMSTNSLVLKATIFKEWYADRIQPWLHYIPIDPSYSDLFDVMSFFNGDLDGKNAHEDLAQYVAQAGRKWAQEHWRMADMQAYASRLILEWARATSLDRASMDFVLPG